MTWVKPQSDPCSFRKFYTALICSSCLPSLIHLTRPAVEVGGCCQRVYPRYYVLILGNSGLRTGEARSLTWRDVSFTKTLTGEKRLIFTVRGKTGEREVVCNAGGDIWVTELQQHRQQEGGSAVSPSETLFCHPDGTPIRSFKKSFEQALRKAGVLFDSDGKKRTPYSLRHTYATVRLSEGVIFQLAANMGTSVEMLETFYGKKRVRDPKMATEITKVANAKIVRF